VLKAIDLVVAPATVFCLLGPNGAGKTTTVRILATLTAPDGGTARVAGADVVADRPRVRERISLTGQDAALDELQSGAENLEMMARLRGLPAPVARARAGELLERFDLVSASRRRTATYSGGMRRRLDLAASLVRAPEVLFLDEPTTGLDPESRRELWTLLKEFVADGTTLILTTQYLEEADRTADQVVVLESGRIAAEGTPSELKARVGGERIAVTLGSTGNVEVASAALRQFADGQITSDPDNSEVVVPVAPGTRLMEVVRALDAAGVDASDVHRREATLDDVFLTLTKTKPKTRQPEPLETAA
jgi:ABC-2 type transport system ATP-binding protein